MRSRKKHKPEDWVDTYDKMTPEYLKQHLIESRDWNVLDEVNHAVTTIREVRGLERPVELIEISDDDKELVNESADALQTIRDMQTFSDIEDEDLLCFDSIPLPRCPNSIENHQNTTTTETVPVGSITAYEHNSTWNRFSDREKELSDPASFCGKEMREENFRLCSKKVFLTWPRHDYQKDDVLKNILQLWPDKVEACWISKEYHKDGTPHLHVIIFFKEKIDFKGFNQLDAITGKHGNYRAVRHARPAVFYCIKTDPEPIRYGIAQEFEESGKETKSNQVAKMLLAGSKPVDVLLKDPGFYLMHGKNIKGLHNEIRQLKHIEKQKKEFNCELQDWQKEVVRRLDSQDSRKVLWVVDGEGGKGKTFLTEWLEVNRDCFLTGDGKYQDITFDYQCQEYVAFDFSRPYQKYVSYALIEKFKDGKIFSTKYESVRKSKKAKVVVFANWEPDKKQLTSEGLGNRWDIYIVTPGRDHEQKFDFSIPRGSQDNVSI